MRLLDNPFIFFTSISCNGFIYYKKDVQENHYKNYIRGRAIVLEKLFR